MSGRGWGREDPEGIGVMTCKIEDKGRASLGRDQRGLSTVEYALLFVLIVGASASLWSHLGDKVHSAVTGANAEYDNALK